MLTDKEWAAQMSEVMTPEYFEVNYLRFLSEVYFKFYEQHRTFPSFQMIISVIKDELREGNDVILQQQIIDYLKKIKFNPDLGDLEYVKDNALAFCRKQALKEALITAVDLIEEGKHESVVNLVKKAVSVGIPTSVGHDFHKDIEARFIKIDRHPVPTGIHQLDKKGVLNGGLGRGEIGVVTAPTGVGKSHFLVNTGANALRAKKNVLHYTFELTETAVGIRYDSNLCGIPSNDVIDNKEKVKKVYEESDFGRLYIKEYPTGFPTVMTLRAHVEKLSMQGFVPDVILIDYADIMRSTRKYDSMRHELKLIYEELRNFAQDMNIPIWTASQANREAANSDVVGLENMSEAYGKAMVADVVVTLSRKAKEKSTGYGRMFVAKNRAGRDGILFHLSMDCSRSTFTVLDENEESTLQDVIAKSEARQKQSGLDALRKVQEKARQIVEE
jgi:hypothetical protein